MNRVLIDALTALAVLLAVSGGLVRIAVVR